MRRACIADRFTSVEAGPTSIGAGHVTFAAHDESDAALDSGFHVRCPNILEEHDRAQMSHVGNGLATAMEGV